MTEQAQENRYWTHEEIGSEASGICEVSAALQRAVEAMEALPSRGGELCGEASVSDDLVAARGILDRVDRACGHATDAAMQSYADYAEEQAAAIAAEAAEREEG